MPFVPGDPNINREGRPKGSVSVVQAIKKKLEEIPEGEKKTYLELLVNQVMEKGLAGDVSMIKDIIDRVDGKPLQTQEIDMTTKGESINPDIDLDALAIKMEKEIKDKKCQS
jgi:hypothetical protein